MNVGITLRIDDYPARLEKRDAVDQSLVDWVIEAGHTPVLIPNKLHNRHVQEGNLLENFLIKMEIKALILSGGGDIGVAPERDCTEYFLLDWAKKNKICVLGICRGMQIMAVHAGAKLLKIDGHVATRHKLVVHGSNGKWPDFVNSYHSLVVSECPKGYSASATSHSGSIEAMIHNTNPWEGWMWHPERESTFGQIELARFRRMLSNES